MTAERAEQLPHGGTFRETQSFVSGRNIPLYLMRDGIVVGDKVFVVSLNAGNNGVFSVGIANLTDGQKFVQEAELSVVKMRKFLRYEYKDQAGDTILLRVGMERNERGKRILGFTLLTFSKIERVSDLGIIFKRAERPSS